MKHKIRQIIKDKKGIKKTNATNKRNYKRTRRTTNNEENKRTIINT